MDWDAKLLPAGTLAVREGALPVGCYLGESAPTVLPLQRCIGHRLQEPAALLLTLKR